MIENANIIFPVTNSLHSPSPELDLRSIGGITPGTPGTPASETSGSSPRFQGHRSGSSSVLGASSRSLSSKPDSTQNSPALNTKFGVQGPGSSTLPRVGADNLEKRSEERGSSDPVTPGTPSNRCKRTHSFRKMINLNKVLFRFI